MSARPSAAGKFFVGMLAATRRKRPTEKIYEK
jgi:hypothetical protein